MIYYEKLGSARNDNITYDYGGVDSDIAYKCARIHTKTRTRSKMKNKN